jgi:hypothetical protein
VSELEQALVALGDNVEFPPAPDLVPAVRARLGERRERRAWWVAAVALAVVALAVAFAVPPARTAILRFFHIGGVTIIRVDTLPPAQERPLGSGLGGRKSLAEAQRTVGYRLVLPHGERPAHAYVFENIVSMLLRVHGKLVLLSEVPDYGVVKKTAISETRIEEIGVNGERGYWISGKRHVVQLFDEPPRFAGNVLVWTRGKLALRLEGPLTKDEALAVARGIR